MSLLGTLFAVNWFFGDKIDRICSAVENNSRAQRNYAPSSNTSSDGLIIKEMTEADYVFHFGEYHEVSDYTSWDVNDGTGVFKLKYSCPIEEINKAEYLDVNFEDLLWLRKYKVDKKIYYRTYKDDSREWHKLDIKAPYHWEGRYLIICPQLYSLIKELESEKYGEPHEEEQIVV